MHYKTNSYGFNVKLIKEAKTFDFITLSDEHSEYSKIPRNFILDNGKYMHFKDAPQCEFELQIFVTLQQLEQFRVKESDNARF